MRGSSVNPSILYTLPGFPDGLSNTKVTEESIQVYNYYLANRPLIDVKYASEAKDRGQGFAVVIWKDMLTHEIHTSFIPADNPQDGFVHPKLTGYDGVQYKLDKKGFNLFIENHAKTPTKSKYSQEELIKHLGSSIICKNGTYYLYRVNSDQPRGQTTGIIHTRAVEILKRIYGDRFPNIQTDDYIYTIGGGLILSTNPMRPIKRALTRSAVLTYFSVQQNEEMLLMARHEEIEVSENGKSLVPNLQTTKSLYQKEGSILNGKKDREKRALWWIQREAPTPILEELLKAWDKQLFGNKIQKALQDLMFDDAPLKAGHGEHIRSYYSHATPAQKNELLALQMLLGLTRSSPQFPDNLHPHLSNWKGAAYDPIERALFFITKNADEIARTYNRSRETIVSRLLDIQYASANQVTLLMAAVCSRNIAAVKILLAHKASVHLKNNDGYSAFELASQEYQKKNDELSTSIYQILGDAMIKDSHKIEILTAAEQGDIEFIVTSMNENEVQDNLSIWQDALFIAAKNGFLNIVETLLEANVVYNQEQSQRIINFYHHVIDAKSHPHVAKKLLEDTHTIRICLEELAQNNDRDLGKNIDYFLELMTAHDLCEKFAADSEAVLKALVLEGDIKKIDTFFMLERKIYEADKEAALSLHHMFDIMNSAKNLQEYDGKNALFTAAKNHHLNIVEALLDIHVSYKEESVSDIVEFYIHVFEANPTLQLAKKLLFDTRTLRNILHKLSEDEYQNATKNFHYFIQQLATYALTDKFNADSVAIFDDLVLTGDIKKLNAFYMLEKKIYASDKSLVVTFMQMFEVITQKIVMTEILGKEEYKELVNRLFVDLSHYIVARKIFIIDLLNNKINSANNNVKYYQTVRTLLNDNIGIYDNEIGIKLSTSATLDEQFIIAQNIIALITLTSNLQNNSPQQSEMLTSYYYDLSHLFENKRIHLSERAITLVEQTYLLLEEFCLKTPGAQKLHQFKNNILDHMVIIKKTKFHYFEQGKQQKFQQVTHCLDEHRRQMILAKSLQDLENALHKLCEALKNIPDKKLHNMKRTKNAINSLHILLSEINAARKNVQSNHIKKMGFFNSPIVNEQPPKVIHTKVNANNNALAR